jgi:hypothetical protein
MPMGSRMNLRAAASGRKAWGRLEDPGLSRAEACSGAHARARPPRCPPRLLRSSGRIKGAQPPGSHLQDVGFLGLRPMGRGLGQQRLMRVAAGCPVARAAERRRTAAPAASAPRAACPAACGAAPAALPWPYGSAPREAAVGAGEVQARQLECHVKIPSWGAATSQQLPASTAGLPPHELFP